MLLPRPLAALALSALAMAAQRPVRRDHAIFDYYVLEHDPHSTVSIHELSAALGLEVVEPVGELLDHWLLSLRRSEITRRDGGDPVLDTLHRLRTAARAPHLDGHHVRSLDETHHAKRLVNSVRYVERQTLRQRTKRVVPAEFEERQKEGDNMPHAQTVDPLKVAAKFGIHDPLFAEQWHIVSPTYPEHMMNVTPAWESGITGKGVIVAMVDDGIDYESDDLAPNFYAEGSHDFNDHVALPKPMLADDTHGTRCAGEIAAVKNDVCGVGLAHEAKIAGLRILSGPVTDADEAAALNYNFNKTSIYSCSWGPPDDGKTMDAPSYLNQKAMVNGVQNGRGGKGSIFVFASGNGAGSGDQCNFDGYTNSIFSVTVAAVDHAGKHPYYSEVCAANMVVTYSSGGGQHIVTTNVGKAQCSKHHGGTSAAAPLASAVFALALQARPDLTWRDIQHLCVNFAVQINRKDPDWELTAAKRPYSYKYGYGRLDAARYVEAAKTWKLVKPQAFFETPIAELNGADMSKDGKMTGGEFIRKGGVTHNFEVTSAHLKQANFESLEHVTVKVWINHPRRGDVQVELTSPSGIKSILAGTRQYDEDPNGFVGWQFSTIKHWDENPLGIWTLRVLDQGKPERKGYFLGWSMTLWGAVIDPALYKPWVLPNPHADADEEPQEVGATSGVSTSTGPPPVTTTLPGANVPNKTKVHAKPTDNLPTDHGVATGEDHKPGFPQPTNDLSSPGSPPTTGDGDDDEMPVTPPPSATPSSIVPQVVQDHQWVFSGLAAVAVIGVGASIYLWRRRANQTRAQRATYDPVAEDEEDIAMRSTERQRVIQEREDEFDEDDADHEGAQLTGGRQQPRQLGFHDGFLEDDDPASARSPRVPAPYRDDPQYQDRSPRRSLEADRT